MQRISHLLFLAITALLISSVYSASKLTYGFPYNTSDLAATNPAYNSVYAPTYSIGTLALNYSLTIRISVPNVGASAQLAGFIANLQFGFVDNTVVPPAFTPAVNVDGTPFTFNAAAGNKFQQTYIVAFPAGYALTSGNFFLRTTYTTTITTNNIFQYYYLQLDYFLTAIGVTASNPSNLQTLLRVVDVMRSDIVKVIYVSQKDTRFNFTVYPATVTIAGTLTETYTVTLRSIGAATTGATGLVGNQYALPIIAGLTANKVALATGGEAGPLDAGYPLSTATYSNLFTAAGYYLLEFKVDSTYSGFFSGNINFNTDSYACPFASNYGDYYSNFQGCTSPVTTTGLPCFSFNPITQVCNLCIPGYTLVNGTCYANTTCPARKYFHFGECLDVSPTCGNFDKFTGACLSCIDDVNYNLANGTCTRKTVTCGDRQWQKNYTCYDVSPNCDTYDPITGNCLTCISKFYQLNADGTCTLIVVNCPQGQYAVGLDCVTIPIECLNFDKTLGKCVSCIKGYYVEGGVCKRIVCPVGQVPSNYGIFCVNVSPLCAEYDQISGDCLSCKNTGYTVRNGACLQASSPLAGCQEREELGFGPCVDADLFCSIFDLVSGDCIQCLDGYYIDYTGHCVLTKKCGTNQWTVNGECLQYPENCIEINNLGLCTRCLNSNFRLQQGQCVYFKSCAKQQYLNSGGQCVDVSPNCATWNPSNGQCITCKIIGTQPIQGICCPLGQVYSSGKCVNQVALQNSYQSATGPACLIRHPSLNICVKCAQGYSPDYTVPYACAKEN